MFTLSLIDICGLFTYRLPLR